MSTDDNNIACAACGKEGDGDTMNTCNKCKMVKYCNAACKKKHKSKHKKQCERRAAELHDEVLFKDPLPPDDCPICFLPMPRTEEILFKACCGKLICDGCCFAVMEGDYERGKKKEDIGLCPFCRMPPTRSDEEEVARVKKLMEKGNANAFSAFAGFYDGGLMGLPQDYTKANELYLKAGELGCAAAYYNLGVNYKNGDGMDMDKKKAKYYYELAAINGSVDARYNLGVMEGQAGNTDRCLKHLIIAAKFGHRASLDKIKELFAAGLVTKDEYEQVLRAYHERQLEAKSDARDKAVEYRERLATFRCG